MSLVDTNLNEVAADELYPGLQADALCVAWNRLLARLLALRDTTIIWLPLPDNQAQAEETPPFDFMLSQISPAWQQLHDQHPKGWSVSKPFAGNSPFFYLPAHPFWQHKSSQSNIPKEVVAQTIECCKTSKLSDITIVLPLLHQKTTSQSTHAKSLRLQEQNAKNTLSRIRKELPKATTCSVLTEFNLHQSSIKG